MTTSSINSSNTDQSNTCTYWPKTKKFWNTPIFPNTLQRAQHTFSGNPWGHWLFSIGVGGAAATPMMISSYYNGSEIPGVNKIHSAAFITAISMLSNMVCNVSLNAHEVHSKFVKKEGQTIQITRWELFVGILGTIPKVTIAYQEMSHGAFLSVFCFAMLVYPLMNLRATKVDENPEPKTTAEKRLGGIIAGIAIAGLLGYCGVAGEAIFNIFSKKHPSFLWVLGLSCIPSCAFMKTVIHGCQEVGSTLYKKVIKKKPADRTWQMAAIAGASLTFIILLAYCSAAPAVAANKDYYIADGFEWMGAKHQYVAWLKSVQDACSIVTVLLFNSIGLMEIWKREDKRDVKEALLPVAASAAAKK